MATDRPARRGAEGGRTVRLLLHLASKDVRAPPSRGHPLVRARRARQPALRCWTGADRAHVGPGEWNQRHRHCPDRSPRRSTGPDRLEGAVGRLLAHAPDRTLSDGLGEAWARLRAAGGLAGCDRQRGRARPRASLPRGPRDRGRHDSSTSSSSCSPRWPSPRSDRTWCASSSRRSGSSSGSPSVSACWRDWRGCCWEFRF